jgi:hypothetical protein
MTANKSRADELTVLLKRLGPTTMTHLHALGILLKTFE